MLVSICGSQGSGKSTTVAALLERGGCRTIDRKTSRSILEEWDVTLSEVNNDRPLTIKFQDEILKRKLHDDQEALTDPNTVWYTERTFADLFVYALVAIGKDNEYSEWMDEYFNRCKVAQRIYDRVFYLRGGMFEVKHDGVRGSNQHYSKLVDLTMEHYVQEMTEPDVIEFVESSTVAGRADWIQNALNK